MPEGTFSLLVPITNVTHIPRSEVTCIVPLLLLNKGHDTANQSTTDSMLVGSVVLPNTLRVWARWRQIGGTGRSAVRPGESIDLK